MFEKLDFNGQEDDFYKYSARKGKFLYLQFYDVFLDGNEKVDYKDIKTCVKYDKNLRNTLYIYLATFEEYLRVQVLDKYDLIKVFEYNSKSKVSYAKQLSKCVGIADEPHETSELYSKLNIDLGQLIELVGLIGMENKETCDELDMIRKLRNNVMHHNVVVLGMVRTYAGMIEHRNVVSERIKVLAKYLPDDYGENFLNEIRKIKCDREDYKVEV